MITLQDYINESILEAKAKAEAPKNVEEWFKENVYSNKKGYGEDKKLNQNLHLCIVLIFYLPHILFYLNKHFL